MSQEPKLSPDFDTIAVRLYRHDKVFNDGMQFELSNGLELHLLPTKDGNFPILKVACVRTCEFSSASTGSGIELLWLVNIALPIGYVFGTLHQHEDYVYLYSLKAGSKDQVIINRLHIDTGTEAMTIAVFPFAES
jgi:hypothetical protein